MTNETRHNTKGDVGVASCNYTCFCATAHAYHSQPHPNMAEESGPKVHSKSKPMVSGSTGDKKPPRVQSGPLKTAAGKRGSGSGVRPLPSCASAADPGGGRYTNQASGGEFKLRFSEVRGNLFSCKETASLAHCVSADLHMGKGIASTFKQRFGGVEELKKQGMTCALQTVSLEAACVLFLLLRSQNWRACSAGKGRKVYILPGRCFRAGMCQFWYNYTSLHVCSTMND